MTENLEPNKQKRRPEEEWADAFEALGENVAQWMHQIGIGADADFQQTTMTEPIGNAARAQVRLDLTVGRASISALPADSTSLIEVEAASIGTMEMVTTTEGDLKAVRVRQKRQAQSDLFKPMKDAVDTMARGPELYWNVRISPRVPLTLVIHAALTIDQFDLTELMLTRLEMDGGTGRTAVVFPAGAFTAAIDGGIGILDMTIPSGARATLGLNLGAGSTSIHIGQAGVRATIEGGVGNCEVDIPPGSALRVRAESGLGSIEVPEGVEPVQLESEFISESGLWQTEDFEFAAEKLDIQYEGGVGSLIIREAGE